MAINSQMGPAMMNGMITPSVHSSIHSRLLCAGLVVGDSTSERVHTDRITSKIDRSPAYNEMKSTDDDKSGHRLDHDYDDLQMRDYSPVST